MGVNLIPPVDTNKFMLIIHASRESIIEVFVKGDLKVQLGGK